MQMRMVPSQGISSCVQIKYYFLTKNVIYESPTSANTKFLQSTICVIDLEFIF